MKRIQKPAGDSARLQDMVTSLQSLFAEGRYEEVVTLTRAMTEHFPHYRLGWEILGSTLVQLGRGADALEPLLKSAELAPGDAAAQEILGRVHYHLGRNDLAEASFRRAVKIKPDYAEAHNNLGNILQKGEQLTAAVASFRRALEIKPDYIEAHTNLGAALKDLGKTDEAMACYRRALEIKPDYAEAHNNLGIALGDLGQLDAAIASYRKAIGIRPDYAEAHYNLGLVLLMSGMFSEGWKKYEYRWDITAEKVPRPATRLPQWTGQNPHPGDRLLIFCEQGLGDKLQFSRYIPLAAERFAGKVSVIADRSLQSLFMRSFPGVEILDAVPADQSAWQWHCSLISLPLATGTVLENIPGQTPYLVPDPARIALWKSKITALDLPARTRKIGLVWKPGKGMKIAKLKALSLEQLAPLLNQPGNNTWFSLQKEPDPDSTPWAASGKLIDWSDGLNSFDDTAALMMNMDLIISVDTSVVHLAGGLGLPAWLFNRHVSEWRWMRGREYSPWYPTIHIFTQEAAGDWAGPVRRMMAALAD